MTTKTTDKSAATFVKVAGLLMVLSLTYGVLGLAGIVR